MTIHQEVIELHCVQVLLTLKMLTKHCHFYATGYNILFDSSPKYMIHQDIGSWYRVQVIGDWAKKKKYFAG